MTTAPENAAASLQALLQSKQRQVNVGVHLEAWLYATVSRGRGATQHELEELLGAVSGITHESNVRVTGVKARKGGAISVAVKHGR